MPRSRIAALTALAAALLVLAVWPGRRTVFRVPHPVRGIDRPTGGCHRAGLRPDGFARALPDRRRVRGCGAVRKAEAGGASARHPPAPGEDVVTLPRPWARLLVLAAATLARAGAADAPVGWPAYGGGPEQIR